MNTADSSEAVGLVGLGFLGRGIAASLLANGVRVIAFTQPASGFDEAEAHIDVSLRDMRAHAAIGPELADSWRARFRRAGSLEELSDCGFVIESIREDLQQKLDLFAQLETIIPPTTPIASNTSSLPISILQASGKYSERFVGMHWAEPCHLTRFLEVIRGEQTDDATIEKTLSLARRLGKDPSLVRKDIEGFIVNRLGYAMYREAFHLLEQGIADVETIDKSVRNAFGLWAAVAGPFRWMDLTGVGPYASVMKRLFSQLSNAKDVPKLMEQMVAENRQGVSNGHGFYRYDAAEARTWEERLRENVWIVRQLHEKHFPNSDSKSKG